jgi:hypothetical protein
VSAAHDPSRRALLGASLAAFAAPAVAAARPKNKNKNKQAKDRAKQKRRPKPAQAAVIGRIATVEFDVANESFRVLVLVDGQDLRSDPPVSFDFGLSTAVDFAPAARMQAQLISRIQESVAEDDDLAPGIQQARVAVFLVSDLTS